MKQTFAIAGLLAAAVANPLPAFADDKAATANAATKAKLSTTHVFAAPGTYFITIKVESERDGNAKSPYARIPNLGHVRVVVE